MSSTSLSHLAPAEICFDPYPDNPVPVTEMQGSVCVNVVRDVNDADVFQYRAVSVENINASRAALGRWVRVCMLQLAGMQVIHIHWK